VSSSPRAKLTWRGSFTRKQQMTEFLIGGLAAGVVALVVIVIGRWLVASRFPIRGLTWIYGLSAATAIAVGLPTSWAINRWQRLTADDSGDQSWTIAAAEAWELVTAPRSAVHWLPIAVLVALGLGTARLSLGRWAGTRVGLVTLGPVLIGAWAALWYQLLKSSLYFLPPATSTEKIGYVLVPAFALGSIGLGQWWSLRQRYRAVTETETTADAGSDTAGESDWGLLSLLATILSGTLLLAASGTLLLAATNMIVAAIPVAWWLERRITGPRGPADRYLRAAGSVTWWLPASTGLLIGQGHFFAEVRWELALLWCLSPACLPCLWPRQTVTLSRRFGLALAAATPALVAAAVAAATMFPAASAD
jgi:hypothetical protein